MAERSRGQARSAERGYSEAGLWVVPASFAQERVWMASQLARDVPLYNMVDELAIHARICEQDLRDAVAAVVARHESLRTAFRIEDGTLMQVVHPRIGAAMGFADLRGDDEEEQLQRWATIARNLAFESFDLGRAPLWRATLARLGDEDWVVLFVAHHSVYDAASGFNVYAELTEMCSAAEQGREPSLPELAIQYTEYAAQQRDRLSIANLGDLAEFWSAQLAGLPPVHGVPLDWPRPDQRTFAGADLRAVLPADTQATLPETARRHQATPFMVHLAAYVALLHRRSGRDDIVVGVPVAGRDRAELLPLIGTFVNMLVLRVGTSADSTFGELIDRVRDVCLAAWDHQQMPFQKLVELFGGPRRPGEAPLYQLGFNLLISHEFGSPSSAAEDDLLLEVTDNMVRLEYNTALFDQSTAQGLLCDYVRILAAGLAAPATVMSRLPVSREADNLVSQCAHTPAPDRAPPEHVAPRTAAEELVADLWSEVLGIQQVGALDDFFDRGGHSLQALRILARLSAGCRVELTIRAFFSDTTVAGLAAELERLLTARLEQVSGETA
jgi:hypothetical protein